MKIFKQPEFNVCTCEICGTVFQPDSRDTLEYCFKTEIGINEFDVFVRCPTCNNYCPVTVSGKSETDINVGHKTEGERKYFTSSEVKKMTPKEVRENYDDIVQSMRRW